MFMRKLTLLFLLALCAGSMYAQKLPKGVAKARKAVASILVYKDGMLLRSGTGVFAGGTGEMFSSYSLFLDADSAVTIDTDGNVRPVLRVLGADDMFDCIKLRVAHDKKVVSLPMSTVKAQEGNTLYLVSYGMKKSGVIDMLPVTKVDIVSGEPYYTFNFSMQEQYVSAPVVDGEGALVALMQHSAAGDTINGYAVAASLADKQHITSLNYNSDKFNRIKVQRALPSEQKDAITLLYLNQNSAFSADENEKQSFLVLVDDYIKSYPDSYEGYMIRVNSTPVEKGFFDRAKADWERALAVSEKPDDVYYNISRTYYVAANGFAKDTDEGKTYLDSALVNIDRAISIKREPLYIQFKAEQLMGRGDFAAAFDCYVSLSSTTMRSADNFMQAAKCKAELNELDAAIVYLDSAVATFGTLPVAAMAPYVAERAALKHRVGRSREAVLDYNQYEQLTSGRLNAYFYYLREQAEYDAKMFQHALNDIETAISLAPDMVLYYIEKGRLCYRVKMIDEAIAALDTAVGLAPEQQDAHYLLGRCYMVKGDKERAEAALLKAKQYGHPDAEKQLTTLKK